MKLLYDYHNSKIGFHSMLEGISCVDGYMKWRHIHWHVLTMMVNIKMAMDPYYWEKL